MVIIGGSRGKGEVYPFESSVVLDISICLMRSLFDRVDLFLTLAEFLFVERTLGYLICNAFGACSHT